jgi:hypothetical protein
MAKFKLSSNLDQIWEILTVIQPKIYYFPLSCMKKEILNYTKLWRYLYWSLNVRKEPKLSRLKIGC